MLLFLVIIQFLGDTQTFLNSICVHELLCHALLLQEVVLGDTKASQE